MLALLLPARVSSENLGQRDLRNDVSIDLLDPAGTLARTLIIGSDEIRIPVALQYQRVLSEHFSLLLKAAFVDQFPSASAGPGSVALSFYGADGWFFGVFPCVEIDWHPFSKGLRGFYIGLSGIFSAEITHKDTVAEQSTRTAYEMGLGLGPGWQFIFGGNWSLEIAASLAYGCVLDAYRDSTAFAGLSLIDSRGGVYLGFLF
jgi:hypothetical protein